MVLRAQSAGFGTDKGYGATRGWFMVRGTDVWYGATRAGCGQAGLGLPLPELRAPHAPGQAPNSDRLVMVPATDRQRTGTVTEQSLILTVQ
eukprot:1826915-Rhodomonas_salina.2